MARIWLARFLSRNKPYHRVMTAQDCSSVRCSPHACCPLRCSRLCYSRPQSVEDVETTCIKLDWTRFWLSIGDLQDILNRAGPYDWCPSPLNLEDIRTLDDSRAADDDYDSRTVLDSFTEELSGYSDAMNRHNANAVVSVRTPGPIIRRSSGLSAVLPLQRSRTSRSVGLTLTRSFCSNGARTDSQIPDDKEDKKLSPFSVVLGDNKSLLCKIEEAIKDKEHEFTDDAMKERYKKYVRPQLSCRGLILPENLQHASTKFIHFRSKEITGCRPMYMSVLDVMGHEKRMRDHEWQCFLKHMVKARIFVIEKWDSSLSHVESLMYDYGIIAPDDGTDGEFFKGECDASYDDTKKEAKLSLLIFKGKDIFHCKVYLAVPCESSVLAEAYAAAALLMTADDLGIKKMILWTDCEAIHGILSGEMNVKLHDKNIGVFMMLRELKKSFDRVISMWKSRELNQFANELATMDMKDTLDPGFPRQAMDRWKQQMQGSPVFRFKQKNEVATLVKNFVDNSSFGQRAATLDVMLDVEQVCKFDCLLGLHEGFEPDDLYLAVHEFAKKPEDLQLKIVEFFGPPVEILEEPGAQALEGVKFFRKANLKNTKQGDRKALMVLFDANLWGKSFHTSQLTVVLISPEDAESIPRRKLRKLTALDYARFSRIS